MRINKQSRPWAMAGRRLFRERLKTQDGKDSGISQDGNTVLDTMLDSRLSSFGPVADPIVNADPTQRLLTVLGRFNRHVSLAESGHAHENWCDECMDQLIAGIEIAIAESWVDVKQAMTDSARILQSYEDAGRPARALPFLKKSYEVMCLMVGDLIVGNVRSGVVEKWKTLYVEAVEELRCSGIALVEDHGDTPAHSAKPAQLSVLPPLQKAAPVIIEEKVKAVEQEVIEQKGPLFFEDDETEEEEFEEEDQEQIEDEEETFEEEELEEESVATSAVMEDAFSDMPFDAPCDFESISDASESEAKSTAVMSSALDLAAEEAWTSSDGYVEEEIGEEGAEEEEEKEEEEDEIAEEENIEATVAVPDVIDSTDNAQYADLADESTIEVESIPEEDKPENVESDTIIEEEIQDYLAQLPPLPESCAPAVVEKEEVEVEIEETAEVESAAPSIETEEVAAQLIEDVVQDEEPMVAAEESPAQALLRITSEAFSKGDVAEAKMMALQLAAQMAVLEQERALDRVELVRNDLSQTLTSIQEGDTVTLQARERLQECAARVLGHQSGIEEKQTEISDLRGQVAAMEQRMAELDEAIRALQQKRDDEAQLGAELQADMEMAMYTEGRLAEEMKQLLESEERAKFALEHAQNHVTKLHNSREQQESLILEAEAEVLRQEKSLSDIRHTIDLVLGIAIEPILTKTEAVEEQAEIKEEIVEEEKAIEEQLVETTVGLKEDDDDDDDDDEEEDEEEEEYEDDDEDEEVEDTAQAETEVTTTVVENHLVEDDERWEEYVENDAEDEEEIEDEPLHEEMMLEGDDGEECNEEQEESGEVVQEIAEEEEEWKAEENIAGEILMTFRLVQEGEQQELF